MLHLSIFHLCLRSLYSQEVVGGFWAAVLFLSSQVLVLKWKKVCQYEKYGSELSCSNLVFDFL